MSALLQQLTDAGVTQEDLDAAAAVHLFEKTAAAQSIDLTTFDDAGRAALFETFQKEVLPTYVDGGGSTATKIAGLDDDQIIDLFEKQAAFEGFDVDHATDEQIKLAYGYFVENMLPVMVENGGQPVDVTKLAQVEEAQAKLAEAEMLGRTMAQSFHAELNKLGSVAQAKGALGNIASAVRGARNAPRMAGSAIGGSLKDLATSTPGKVVGGGLAAGAGGAAALLAKKNAKKSEKTASLFDSAAAGRAREILRANGVDPAEFDKTASGDMTGDQAIDLRAREMLEARGFTFQD